MSSDEQTARRIIFRNRAITIFASVITLILLLIGLFGLTRAHQSGPFIGGAVLSAGLWSLWVMGYWTKVIVSSGGVVVDNVFVRHEIPWSQFHDFVLDSGIWVEQRDGQRIWIFGYGGSLMGVITGYRSLKKVYARMEAATAGVRREAAASLRPGTCVKIVWWPLAGYLAIFEGAIFVAHSIH
jgi:hypothetical protein